MILYLKYIRSGKMKKLICSCGNTTFKKSQDSFDSYTLLCNPPITVKHYICETCGKKHKVEYKSSEYADVFTEVILGE